MSDLISRQAAIDALDKEKSNENRPTAERLWANLGLEIGCEKLKTLPSAQPELGKNSPSEQHKMDKLGVKTEETCTDIISRQAAIDAILECCTSDFDNEYECGYDDGLRQGVHRLKHLPSAQPEQKKGKWIEDRLISTGGGTYGVRRCSECEAYYQDVGYGWYYCPNCGARMEVEG